MAISRSKKIKVQVRKFHRWLGIAVGVQLFFWTVSGVFFSWVHIKKVRGEDIAREKDESFLELPTSVVSASDVQNILGQPVRELRVKSFQGKAVYAAYIGERLPFALVDAETGGLLDEISANDAKVFALRDYAGDGEIVKIEKVAKNNVPVYQVAFNDTRKTELLVHRVDGTIISRRNTIWYIYDFLWMLHILDFEEREDFNNKIIKGVSIFGLVTILSGYALFLSSRRRDKTVKSPATSTSVS
ncbi:MAG: hypothetical protein AB7T49_20130 [Oligoflexales bacterium]